ncbi:tRNA (adenosine(37)-N6)-threonylcarbamoyltransferase complex ATPase subunit type 1 TsaE [Rubritalea squalenifaciens]|uniref:tRNA (adenosine(37)-N6)-threonylcarbamoyltransferase complex ATPase subunit type 1 TsaE n=1 Tax=Rubritalea squalenifaciens TaxID=407226 RepID=UPI001160234E|nr:tRNA (adenosine(37)-N6)-threonylcarbamoyltransferase complex ATPase subunit type 1 TsaE [Rubritalea squalenifaciens]
MQGLFPTEILDPEAMKRFGAQIANHLRPGDIVALVGDLGAGKTHITQGICAALGHQGEVTSPTFALVNEYTDSTPPIMHFDLYRMENAQELLDIGWEDYLERDAILIVEWADRFPELIPEGTHCIHIEHLPQGRRLSYDRV